MFRELEILIYHSKICAWKIYGMNAWKLDRRALYSKIRVRNFSGWNKL